MSAELLQCGRAHDVQLTAGQGGLEDVRGVHGAALAAASGADDGVQFVDEDDQLVGVGADLAHDGGQPFLEVPAIAGARDHTRQVQGEHPSSGEYVGHVAVDDPLGEPLHDRGLADTGVTDEHRVVLAAPGQYLDGLLDFPLPADHRVDTALPGQVGEVAAVLVQCGRAGGTRPFAAGLSPLRGRLGRQPGGREVSRVEDVPGGRVRVRGEGAQHMLGADVTGAARPGQVVRVQQGALGGRGQGQ